LEARLLMERQALHASRVEFEWEEERIVVECEMPDEMRVFSVA